jgi:FAD/FMN-containing dehydrogenase
MFDQSAELVKALQASVTGTVCDGEGARQASQDALWNGAARADPLVLVECMNAADIQASVRAAAEYELPVSVLGGGHDWAGRAIRSSGLTLDLHRMSSVAFDPHLAAVTVGGGATIDHVLSELPEDFAIVSGTISTVGVTGLTLGGGYGKLNSKFGLAIDNAIQAEVVLADGSTVTASKEDDSELFWALRGGGGNFGVVTSLTLAAHTLPAVLTAVVFIPLANAKAGLLHLQRVLDEESDDLSVFSALMTGPTGERGLILAPMWTGDAARGEQHLRTLTATPGALLVAEGWSSYKATYDKKFEAAWPKGRGYRMDAYNMLHLDSSVAEALVDCAQGFSSDADCLMLHDFRGAATRVAPEATAFPLRQSHFNVQLLTGWDAATESSEQGIEWLAQSGAKLGALTSLGGYPNVLGPTETTRAEDFYGASANRLRQAKRRYDPDDRFPSAIGRLAFQGN